MSEEYYLELCENPVQFEHASSVNNVFFDEANKQVTLATQKYCCYQVSHYAMVC